MLVSDTGKVYAFGKSCFGEADKFVTTPQLVEGSLKEIFIVQVTIGHFLTAVLSREGKVYTFFWGNENKLGHHTEENDFEPRPLLGALENLPVVQIGAGNCYLLALVCQPNGMSVYSLGCGQGGKLGHGTHNVETQPKLIEQFQTLNLEPVAIAAGDWHSAVLGKDGRVCTWGWAHHGCLGHGIGISYEQTIPKVIEALSGVKAVHVAAGVYTTFVVSENGDAYSFGSSDSSSLGNEQVYCTRLGDMQRHEWTPELVTAMKQANERVIQISPSNCSTWNAHTLALTQSGKLYAFGAGGNGQLGVQLGANQTKRPKPERVMIDLS
ncbi:probable E3 ubiquitin-protein ligase herc3 [Phtheirospermum japonicum]|uniref:Probable E3 ubiquitin-protein ligase herc3 n=1 Tax=Phtheirospermum japonicum TaxID=374723 RepID=A0A830BCI9_9LAMI|nr:probable E3 ubiquitin-protein ligase herc3 [Phtheirospermum japonicum]